MNKNNDSGMFWESIIYSRLKIQLRLIEIKLNLKKKHIDYDISKVSEAN